MREFVAVTTTLQPRAGAYDKPMLALYANYAGVLERLGLSCVLVSPAHSPASVRRLVAASSGLVLTGGEDIEPGRYGEEPHTELGTVNPRRDAVEFRALRSALHCGVPVLGICRGHQLLNVYFGGTLYQDIATEMPGQLSHFQSAGWGEHQHSVNVRPGTRLARILADRHLRINSFHHQAIRDLAPGLRIAAVAEDGLIEAVEHESHPWMIGVQWHPERHEAEAPDTDPNLRVFYAFRDAVTGFATFQRQRARRGRRRRVA